MPGYRAPLLDASRVGHFPLIPSSSLLSGWLSQRYREAYHAELTTLECGFPRVISHFYFGNETFHVESAVKDIRALVATGG